MKKQILKLRSEGKSYREIVKILGCSKGTVSFHCSKLQREKTYARRKQARIDFRNRLRQEAGGKCSICGYAKCFDALDFHHPNSNKEGDVSQLLIQKGHAAADEEAKKCKLVCANCHREIHCKLVRG